MLMMLGAYSFIVFSLGILGFSLKHKHLLLMLLSLEMIVVSLFLVMMMMLSFYDSEFFFCMIFMTLSVCEGSLGLSILVSLIRTHGNDYFNMFNLVW
uniref:NADH-ubiquinone oxidoreductase chain 4L n=1 Tax=Histeroidea sp. 2 KM-2017 TaxID=2219435 RepID=A0A346RG78_9COLE|nr:NADH dehydrogenase subunit 4L [Histeroidea sp. 2 KM-2017]